MLAFGVMSEKRLAIFAVSALGIVAVVLVGFWLVLAIAGAREILSAIGQ